MRASTFLRPARSLALAIAAAIVLVRGVACTVDDLSLEGKQCPCTTGYTCDLATNTCVVGLDANALPTKDGDTTTDAPVGGFVVQRFVATWRTSKSIRWDFDVSGDASEFAEYQLIVGATEDAVRRQDSSTGLFDRRINPELGSFGGRDPVAPGAVARAWTVTDKHPVGKTVFARLIVRDKQGRENASNVISADTRLESRALVLFGDQLLDGSAPTPVDLKRVANDCFNASAGCLQIGKVTCPAVDAGPDAAADAATSCGFEIGLQSFEKDVTANTLTQADFEGAFVEIGVRGGPAASPKPQSDLILSIGAPACRIGGQKCRFRWSNGWSFRPGPKEFRLVQVPLGSLLLDTPGGPGQPLKYEDFAANALRVEAITIDGTWAVGANIGLDQATIRW